MHPHSHSSIRGLELGGLVHEEIFDISPLSFHSTLESEDETKVFSASEESQQLTPLGLIDNSKNKALPHTSVPTSLYTPPYTFKPSSMPSWHLYHRPWIQRAVQRGLLSPSHQWC